MASLYVHTEYELPEDVNIRTDLKPRSDREKPVVALLLNSRRGDMVWFMTPEQARIVRAEIDAALTKHEEGQDVQHDS